jgi:ribose transport system substrate-binding protein
MTRGNRAIWLGAMGTCLVASTAACGGSSTPSSGGGGATPHNLALIVGVKGFDYYTSIECGARAEAQKLGVSLTVDGATQFDPSLQIPVINAVTARHPDAIIVAPTDTKAPTAALLQAQAAGITIVQVDTQVNDTTVGVAKVVSDNYQGGQIAARTLAGLINDQGSVAIISTAPGVSTEDERISGFTDELKSHPNIHVVSTQYDGADLTKSSGAASAIIAATPDLAGGFATNTLSASGLAAGVAQAGRAGATKVVGYDAGTNQLNDLQKGTEQALIAQQPILEGQLAVDVAVAALNHQPYPKAQSTGVTVVTSANLATTSGSIYKSAC